MTGNQTDAKSDALRFESVVNKTLVLFEEKESEHNWEKFDNALSQLIEITSKGVSHYERSYIAGIKSLRYPIQNSVLTTRSKLSSTAIELVEEIAKALGPRFISISEIFVPSILKLFNRTNKVFIKRANKCLGTIIRETKSSNLMPTFKEAMRSQNKQMRACVAGMVLTMLEDNVNGLNIYIDALELIIREASLSANAKKTLAIKDKQQTSRQPVLFTSTKNNRNQHIRFTKENNKSLLLNNNKNQSKPTSKPTRSTTHENIKLSIAVTATDEYIGHSLAYYLLYYHSHDISVFRAIAKQQNEKHVQDLKELGAEIHLIDYDKVSTLENAFSGNLDVVIFVTESDEKKVQFAEITIQTFKKVKINHVGMISSIGADSHFEFLKVYKEIEDMLKQNIKKFCVIRLGLFYENLLFYKPMIDEDGKIKLTLNPIQHKFAPIDLNYIGKAMLILIMALSHMDQQQLVLSASSNDNVTKNTEEQKSFILTFTGHENLSCEQVVKKFNELIGKNITYEETSRDGLKKYLYSLIERNGDGGGEQLLINKIYIDTFLDLLDWIKQGDAVISDDLQRIIGHPGESIDKFLKRNSKYFKQ
ncbi:2659_t:CDS:2 [Entrophospora sp. SA101]|nr:2409_t:CDS:2 [Entrophospora sp. SA101]CAJ0754854.1 20618_t:CDS:2 [Entrophospora sp. SA101]CAJ0758639.1 2659_t:CDS:2 [Entrophospora sp. SA101]CAJ0846364.1 14229_t:CDS:2 [Entrophospora sp. SA101]